MLQVSPLTFFWTETVITFPIIPGLCVVTMTTVTGLKSEDKNVTEAPPEAKVAAGGSQALQGMRTNQVGGNIGLLRLAVTIHTLHQYP